MLRIVAAIALLVSTALHAALAQGDFKPVDQAASQPEFFAFRARLQAAVARRDQGALLAVVHQDIKNSFGGSGGVDEFKQVWALDEPGSRVWETLSAALALGGSFLPDGRFVAPYVFSQWPAGTDPYGFVAIIGSGVRVHAQPAASSATLHTLSFEIVEEVQTTSSSRDWIAVAPVGGQTGYVERRLARSPLDYRAMFEKSGGRWQMTTFIAGD